MLCGYIRDDEEKIIWFFFRREREMERDRRGRGERNFDFLLGKRERKIFWFFFKGEKKERCCFVIKILGYKIVRINE